MDTGDTYFKVYRKLFDNGLWVNPVACRLFIWMLGNAVYAEKGVELGTLTVKRGEYLRSYRKLQADLSFLDNRERKFYSLSTLHRATEYLCHLQIITKRETELGTLFTIVNYDKYQPLRNTFQQFSEDKSSENEKLGTQPGTTSEQQANNTNKEKKEDKIYSPNSNEFRLAQLLFELLRYRNPNHKEPDIQKWSKHIDLMIRLDKREPSEIEKIIRWTQNQPAQSNGFTWANNILSTQKLREKYDQLFLLMNSTNNGNENDLDDF